MEWIKLGKIFNPIEHKLLGNCVDYAQSPQVLMFEDFVRIYFSTREKDSTGKYLSHIAYVDMDKAFLNVINISQDTVVPLGVVGGFDQHGIFPMNVIKHKDKIFGYTCGWNRKVSVSVDTSIGLAISCDEGETFAKYGEGPIMTATLNEPFLVGDPFVKIIDNMFHMWYIFGTQWKLFEGCEVAERIYKIAHATSIDGINWNREGHAIVNDVLRDECQALPTVFYHKGKYHMIFCFREATDFRNNKNRGYKLGYAYSHDLMRWTRDDTQVGIKGTEGEWDSDMMCYPHVFECDGKIMMLYNGNAFGRHGFGLAVLKD